MFHARVVVDAPEGEHEQRLGFVEAGDESAITGDGTEIENGLVAICEQLEIQRREIIAQLALVFAGEQVELAIATVVSDQRAVGEQFGQDFRNRCAIVLADAIPGFKGGPG